jgi:hypothetical protein
MIGLNPWDIFAFIGFIFLILFFYAGKNLVWAAFSVGLVVAIIVCGIYFIKDDFWPWELFKKIIIIITYTGIIIELLMRLIGVFKRKKT